MNYFFCIGATVLLVVCLAMLARRREVLRSGGKTTGRVVAHEKRERDDGTSFHPVFTFTDHNGHEHQITSSAGWSAPRPQVGTTVSIRYVLSRPQRAYIDSFYHLWFWPLALAMFAAILALAAWQST